MTESKRGPLTEKQITYAATDRVDDYRQLASAFMTEVFDLLPGDYLITDESMLLDFTEFDASDTSQIWTRIRKAYAVEKSDTSSEKPVDIFAAIQRRRSVQ